MSRNAGGTTLGQVAQIGPPAITIERSFPQKREWLDTVFKVSLQRLPPNGEAVGHPWLLSLARKNILCYYGKFFSFGYALAQYQIPLVSAGRPTTLAPPFWSRRYLAIEEVLMRVAILWFIGFNGTVHWSLCWRGLGVTLSSFTFVTSLTSTIMPWFTLKNFCTSLSGAPQKCFKSGPALANAGPAANPKFTFD